jgi:nitrate/TMAO reductase-like tetraheme cytochrome c subunit
MSNPRFVARAWPYALVAGILGVGVVLAEIPTTPQDFVHGGSQPGSLVQKLVAANTCQVCHSYYDDPDHEPFDLWNSSMMGQAARDPVFYAALAVANQEVAGAGEFCLRCHAPMGWIEGRCSTPDGSALTGSDFEGVSCSVCHRMINPSYVPGVSPAEDVDLLAALPNPVMGPGGATTISNPPPNPGNASYIFDRYDRRRGPYVLGEHPHAWIKSEYHRASEMCATCHDVSNPVFTKQADGSYKPGPLDQAHPDGNKYHMASEQRTYSEWLHSSFSQGPVELGSRYGTNQSGVSSCQDCHMPRDPGHGCDPQLGASLRQDLARHYFAGANTWVLKAVRALYPDNDTRLTSEGVAASLDRTFEMLRDASDMELYQSGEELVVRVTNQTGHKLPTGYPEGRRMWINIRFLDSSGQMVAERGQYDSVTATLHEHDTKVYHAEMGIDEFMGSLLGRPAGPAMSLAVNNTMYFDNRIPPRGFTNANYASVQASPVGYSYADGQYWDDTSFVIPANAARAEVRVMYQTTSREYIEFLRDANTTNGAGMTAYNQWVAQGKSAPAEMDVATIVFSACPADLDDGTFTGTPDGGVTVDDLIHFVTLFGNGDPRADLDDGSGTGTRDQGVTIEDLIYFLDHFTLGC